MTVLQSYLTGDSDPHPFSFSYSSIAQAVKWDVMVRITSIVFIHYKGDTVNDNLYARIYAHDGEFGVDGLPTGEPLAQSLPFDSSALTESPEEIEYLFSVPVEVAAGVPVFIVCYFDGVPDTGTVYTTRSEDTPAPPGTCATKHGEGDWTLRDYWLHHEIRGTIPTNTTIGVQSMTGVQSIHF